MTQDRGLLSLTANCLLHVAISYQTPAKRLHQLPRLLQVAETTTVDLNSLTMTLTSLIKNIFVACFVQMSALKVSVSGHFYLLVTIQDTF